MSGHEGKTATHTIEAITPEIKESNYFITSGVGVIVGPD
jgi:hypothetical protein